MTLVEKQIFNQLQIATLLIMNRPLLIWSFHLFIYFMFPFSPIPSNTSSKLMDTIDVEQTAYTFLEQQRRRKLLRKIKRGCQ